MQYLIRVGDALSQLFNVVVLLGTNPNESVSGRCYRRTVLEGADKYWPMAYRAINAVFFAQENHCRQSHVNDVERAKRLLEM